MTMDMMEKLKPADTVRKLDKYIIGQQQAKRSVAIALRNRWRRQNVPDELRDEIAPKNIILIGPTGFPCWRTRPFTKWKPQNLPRWATWAAMWSRWCGTCSS